MIHDKTVSRGNMRRGLAEMTEKKVDTREPEKFGFKVFGPVMWFVGNRVHFLRHFAAALALISSYMGLRRLNLGFKESSRLSLKGYGPL